MIGCRRSKSPRCGGTAGAAAGAAVALVHIRAGIPGNAILRAVPAMALGLSLVPRRMAGSAMAASAGMTASLLVANGAGRMPPAALAGLLALGPALDVAMIGAPVGWRLYARFALAGAVANALAFVIRLSSSWLGIELAGEQEIRIVRCHGLCQLHGLRGDRGTRQRGGLVSLASTRRPARCQP